MQERKHMIAPKNWTFQVLILIAMIISACGAKPQAEADIATAVAQTVQAQNSLTEIADRPTETSVPPTEILSFTEAPPTEGPSGTAANPGCVASANLVSENPPDNVLLKPGEYFWKTWTFLNTGTCVWNTSYKLVFWDGELMGGLVSYPFSEIVNPGETMDLSIYLLAPAAEGSFTGFWRFETPWEEYFGVGAQASSFYVQISTAEKLRYGIANVTYNLVRDPETGCPLNVRYYVYATVTSNGPVTFSYYWDQSDGNESGIRTVKLKDAESVTLERSWLISNNDSPNPRWIKLVITDPVYRDYGEVPILHNCFISE